MGNESHSEMDRNGTYAFSPWRCVRGAMHACTYTWLDKALVPLTKPVCIPFYFFHRAHAPFDIFVYRGKKPKVYTEQWLAIIARNTAIEIIAELEACLSLSATGGSAFLSGSPQALSSPLSARRTRCNRRFLTSQPSRAPFVDGH